MADNIADDNLRNELLNRLMKPKVNPKSLIETYPYQPGEIKVQENNEPVVLKASWKAHYGDVIGVFFYNVLDGKLDYVSHTIHPNHDNFAKFKEYSNTKGMVRGRLFRDDDKVIIYFHTDDYYPFKVSEDILTDLYKKVEEISKEHISYIVDESGRSLLEQKDNSKGLVEQCLEHQLKEGIKPDVNGENRLKIMEKVKFNVMESMFRKRK